MGLEVKVDSLEVMVVILTSQELSPFTDETVHTCYARSRPWNLNKI